METASTITQSLNYSIQIFLPFSGFDQLADLALDQVAFQGADVADVQLAVQVIGFVLKGTGEQVVGGLLKQLSRCILSTNGSHLGAAHIFAEVWDAETTFALRVAAFLVDDFRIDQHKL